MDLPSIAQRIEIEETQFRAPVSESLAQKLGGTMNFILDHFVIPPGAIFDYAAPEVTVPSGWIVCDGRAVSRTTFFNLFGAIGTYWGIGDGLTTFNVPDMRGNFTRMVDLTLSGQKGFDPDHASRTPTGTGGTEDVGSLQTGQVQAHSHNIQLFSGAGGGAVKVTGDSNGIATFPNQPTAGAGGAETRPLNLYVLKIIKT